MNAFAGFLLMLSFCSEHPAQAEGQYFPKGVFARKDLEFSDFVADRLGEGLRKLEEPSLWKTSRDDPDAEAYRFFWWATGEEPISFRLTKEGDGSVLLVSQLVRGVGKDQEQARTLRAIALTAKQWDDTVNLLNKTPFWTAPTSVKESRGIGDGDRILIEAVTKGRYHVIDRAGSTTSESYKVFCRYLMSISGSPMLNVWDKWRKAERKDPNYKREYKETEDAGEIKEEK